MPCPNPKQAYFQLLPDGKKKLRFSNVLAENFRNGLALPDDCFSLPCGDCMTCRLEKSSTDALRCVHESRMVEESCFVTLTYDDENLRKHCPLTDGGYSLVRKHVQDFVKRLRDRFSRGWTYVLRDGKERVCQFDRIRVYGCGEYGEKNGRPHFHLCLFNCFFPDRELEGERDGFRYYSSKCLASLWDYGFVSVCDFTFETAAYVARYTTKKITGKKAIDHYRGRLPEFPIYPTRGGGLGKPWFDKYGKTDVIPTDTCIVRRTPRTVPEYYDRLRSRFDPEGLAEAKRKRSERAKLKAHDNTYARLQDKERCMLSKVKSLIRRIER